MSDRQGGRKPKSAKAAKAVPAEPATPVVMAAPIGTATPVAAEVPVAVLVAEEAQIPSVGLDAPSSLKLDSQCTLRESIAMKAALLEQLELGSDVVLDGSAVSKVDTAGLQLLAAFARQMQNTGRQITWEGASDELQRSAMQLDLADLIGLNIPVMVQS